MNLSGANTTHVLLAEDDNEDYYIFSVAIQQVPLTVLLTRAENGELLMKLLDEKVPDILFLDMLMPCKDGQQCLREIRANKKYDSLPIVVYSSLDDLRTIEFCYREGSNLYAIKPSSFDELKTILERILTIDWRKVMYFPTFSDFVLNPH